MSYKRKTGEKWWCDLISASVYCPTEIETLETLTYKNQDREKKDLHNKKEDLKCAFPSSVLQEDGLGVETRVWKA